MADEVTVELLDSDGVPRSRFVDADSAIAAQRRTARRAWRRGIVVGAAGASAAFVVANWLNDRD